MSRRVYLCGFIFFLLSRCGFADDSTAGAFQWNLQTTEISQTLFQFPAPYSGSNSLLSRDETEITHASLLTLKKNFASNLLLDADVQYIQGHGAGGGNGTGLAGYLNDEIVRISTVGKDAYFARYFVQWNRPLSSDNQLILTLGKFAVSDVFEKNRYANSVDNQFMNEGMVNNLAWDYAADTRGYSGGMALQWAHQNWTLRFGSFQMPVRANGIRLAGDFGGNRGDQMELEIHPATAVLRFLVYQNHADMGDYNDAIALAGQTGTAPNIVAVEHPGEVKTGFALNGEQPLADDGDTGLFFRYGWNDGQTESFAYTESDRFISIGVQISGKRWHCDSDHVGIGLQQSDLSTAHAQYLALGGDGFQLGDGALSYGPERTGEIYYLFGLSKQSSLSLDYQHVINPGNNRDRGPVDAVALRFHFQAQ